MSFQRKLLVVALASVLPMVSAHAQSAADLQKEISALKAQLQALQSKVEALGAKSEATVSPQQVSKIELRLDQADDEAEKSGFKGIKINGVLEASYKYNDLEQSHTFGTSAGYADEFAMVQITKESQDGQGVDWTLRLLPGSNTYSHVHEASVSVPLDKENRLIGGLIPDFQGYEWSFANANPTLGNQLLTHNALFDLAGATTYAGLGMSHNFGGSTYALKWLIGNVDPANDSLALPAVTNSKKSTGLAYRADWFINEYAFVGLSGAHGQGNREFNIMAIDGGYVRGDWAFNGHLNFGDQTGAAANGGNASWKGISGLVGYKLTPRLQLLARADFIENRSNGGGTYAYNGGLDSTDVDGNPVYNDTATGLGPERDANGAQIDPNVGANVSRLTLGTNYQINANTQWKLEYRLDQSTGYNFLDADGNWKNKKNSFGTGIVVSF
ncbi:MAG: DUF3138 family protein [Burkholderiales bacterium]|nr:DUF3138 family protein [Burkholderiales bacterium]